MVLDKNGYDLDPTAESFIMDCFDIASPDFVPNTIYMLDHEERLGDFDLKGSEFGWWAREWNNDHYTVNGEVLCEDNIQKFDQTDGEFIDDRDEYLRHLHNKPSDKGICFKCNYMVVGLTCLQM